MADGITHIHPDKLKPKNGRVQKAPIKQQLKENKATIRDRIFYWNGTMALESIALESI